MSSIQISESNPYMYHIWTDGSYRPPGNASCAYLIFHQKQNSVVDMKRYAYRNRTINAMELMAINHALDYPNSNHVTIYTDSAYAILCLTHGRRAWAKTNWLTPLGEPVKNKDLIMEISEKLDKKKYTKLVKVAAHQGDPWNSIVDKLATDLSKKMMNDPDFKDGEYPILFNK